MDAWVDFAAHEIELPASLWVYPVFGYLPANQAVTDKAKADLASALQVRGRELGLRPWGWG